MATATAEKPQQQSLFQEIVLELCDKIAAVKEFKSLMKEIEDDIPMELEELQLSLKDLKKQVRERKAAHIKQIIEENTDYNEYREHLQAAKESIAENKMKLFVEAANQTREHGDLDRTILVQGAPFRLQTQKEVQVYLNGKAVK